MKDTAAWFRVSGDDQRSDNQIPEVERFCAHHGLRIVRRFVLHDSAWQNGTGGPEYQAAVREAKASAWAGEFEVVVVWALDRITRLGAEDALRLIREFRERGCTLLSVKEDWLNGSPEIVDVLVAFAGWQAQQESQRRSERVRAGMARAKAEGKVIGGRKLGAKNKPRRVAA
jgi:DNA invertase Pin-like site-specific DNA recombinase